MLPSRHDQTFSKRQLDRPSSESGSQILQCDRASDSIFGTGFCDFIGWIGQQSVRVECHLLEVLSRGIMSTNENRGAGNCGAVAANPCAGSLQEEVQVTERSSRRQVVADRTRRSLFHSRAQRFGAKQPSGKPLSACRWRRETSGRNRRRIAPIATERRGVHTSNRREALGTQSASRFDAAPFRYVASRARNASPPRCLMVNSPDARSDLWSTTIRCRPGEAVARNGQRLASGRGTATDMDDDF